MVDWKSLTLQQKVGQMLICGFQGTEPSTEIMELIQHDWIGGVIFFSRNIRHVQQIYELSKALQEQTRSHNQPPLIISIDQEGGVVARIVEGVTLMPGNMALGATRNVQGAYEAGLVVGKEMRALGINLNFAPSVDVYNNPANPVIGVRSYGEDPLLVSELGAATVKGFQAAGLSATIKHFPGHGDTDIDSHLDLPIIKHDIHRIQTVELIPFKQAIKAGADALMTAHILFSAWDEHVPTTLSKRLLQHYLREELHFEGVIITDCLEMKAIADRYGVEEAAILAVEAGVDLLLFSHSADKQRRAIHAIIQAVEKGRISEERINQSVQRILQLKLKRDMQSMPESWEEASKLLCEPASQLLARKLSEESMTLLKGIEGLPLDASLPVFCIWPKIVVTTDVDEIFAQPDTLGLKLQDQGFTVKEYIMETNPSAEEIEGILEQSEGYPQVLVASYNASMFPQQVDLIKRLHQKLGRKLVVVALRSPFDYTLFREIDHYLAIYESRPLALESAAKVLAGRIKARGQLPVSLTI